MKNGEKIQILKINISSMKILFKLKFGSHLYGTETSQSDQDYKGVFQASLEDIILKRDRHVINENTKGSHVGYRNSPTDIDTEFKELREFLREALEGQTYALDMLFAPVNMYISSSPEWDFIVENRHKLLSKNIEPFLGYIRQQTAKYGLKGARLAELQRVLQYFESKPEKELVGDHVAGLALGEFVSVCEVVQERPYGEKPITEQYLEVLGKKFQFKTKISSILGPLRKFDAEYGTRSRMAAKNGGIDWKAVSHAFRCSFQLLDLAEKHEIVFPLKEAEFLKQIKTGQIAWLDLHEQLSDLMEKSFKALGNSTLPLKPDYKFWEDFIISTYKKSI